MFKKFAKVSAASMLSAVMLIASGIGVNAEEIDKVETDITIKVTEDTVINPGEPGEPGEGGGEIVDPKGNLTFWVKPAALEFNGKFSQTNNYHVKAVKKDNSDERRLVVADIRDSKHGWSVLANLSELKNDNGNVSTGYSLTADAELGYYEVEADGDDFKVNQTFKSGDNGVELVESGKITVKPGTPNKIYAAKEGAKNGKGYNVTKLENFDIEFEAGVGHAGETKGKIVWTLNDTIQ